MTLGEMRMQPHARVPPRYFEMSCVGKVWLNILNLTVGGNFRPSRITRPKWFCKVVGLRLRQNTDSKGTRVGQKSGSTKDQAARKKKAPADNSTPLMTLANPGRRGGH